MFRFPGVAGLIAAIIVEPHEGVFEHQDQGGVGILPLLIAFLVAQRYFVQGITLTGLKG